jgi:hypothetical protein
VRSAPEHDVGVEQGEELAEIAAARGGEEGLERLAITAFAARHRYAAYSVWRRHHPSALPDDEAIPY